MSLPQSSVLERSPQTGAQLALSAFYYLDNFHRVLNWVQDYSADLLDGSEQRLLTEFLSLSRPAQALLVRLLMRKGPAFRVDKLRYAELGDVVAVVPSLVQSGLLQSVSMLDIDSFLHLYTLADLRQQWPDCPKSWSKSQWQSYLLNSYPSGLPAGPDIICLPEPTQRWSQTLLLLFFGNLRQDWTEFVLSDLGLYRYQTVSFAAGSRAFEHIGQVKQYLFFHESREQAAQASEAELGECLSAILPLIVASDTDNDWLARRRDKTLFALGQIAEKKAAHLELALQAYQASAWPMAAMRMVRVLELQGNHQLAWDTALSVLQRQSSEAVQQKILRMLPRLQAKLPHRMGEKDAICRDAKPRADSIKQDTLVLPGPSPEHRVETQVLQSLRSPESAVYYVENSLILALLGLLCWEALFKTVPGAFFHPYQRGPADLHDPGFYTARLDEFECCWQALGDGSYKQKILQRWDQKYGIQCVYVPWAHLDRTCLELALDCIPASHLHAVFLRILQDTRENRSGLPDLIRFFPAQQSYEWIEVKGPGDRLQDNQRRWLSFFEQHQIPVWVCYVRWEPSCTQ